MMRLRYLCFALVTSMASSQQLTTLETVLLKRGLIRQDIVFIGNIPGMDDAMVAVKTIRLREGQSGHSSTGLQIVIVGPDPLNASAVSYIDKDEIVPLSEGLAKLVRFGGEPGDPDDDTMLRYRTKDDFVVFITRSGAGCRVQDVQIFFAYSIPAIETLKSYIDSARTLLVRN